MSDQFAGRTKGLSSPAENAAPISPSDAADLPNVCRAIYIGAGGDLRLTTVGGDTVTFRNAPEGLFPVRARRVHATDTTAADLIAVW
ncbi:MAG: hypothetical protein AAF322_08570 [Pseudomonadota bacterium]